MRPFKRSDGAIRRVAPGKLGCCCPAVCPIDGTITVTFAGIVKDPGYIGTAFPPNGSHVLAWTGVNWFLTTPFGDIGGTPVDLDIFVSCEGAGLFSIGTNLSFGPNGVFTSDSPVLEGVAVANQLTSLSGTPFYDGTGSVTHVP